MDSFPANLSVGGVHAYRFGNMHPRNLLTASLSLIFEGLDWPVTFSLLAKAPALFTIVVD
jgi:hypothetical protein